MKLSLLPEAERDLEIGADFYESQRKGLGAYFNDCLASDIESLKLYGGLHEQYRGFFRSFSKRFPFAVYYVVLSGIDSLLQLFSKKFESPFPVDRMWTYKPLDSTTIRHS